MLGLTRGELAGFDYRLRVGSVLPPESTGILHGIPVLFADGRHIARVWYRHTERNALPVCGTTKELVRMVWKSRLDHIS